MSNRFDVEKIISENKELQKYLYTRGFLFTNANVNYELFPFYGKWNVQKIGNYTLSNDKKVKVFKVKTEKEIIILIGHVYNPFDGLIDENEILNKYANSNDRISYMNEWTGVFTIIIISENGVEIFGDCAGMQANYYGFVRGDFYLTSHSQLIGDLCELKRSKYVQKITKYRFWQMYGIFLPGDISQFDEIKRLVPNTFVRVNMQNSQCDIIRFYPSSDLVNNSNENEYNRTIEKIGSLMNKNIELISKKWSKPAISMTGGMDSKATVACTNGLYDKFKYYSYVTMDGDIPDSKAAKTIAEKIGVEHKTYVVSRNDNDFENLNKITKIMEHNLGDLGIVNPNDVRKRIYFMDTSEFDVEVKSWVSEIGRANYYKKFGLKKMPKRLRPRQMTSMYKFFSYNRYTEKLTERIFKEYINKTKFNEIYNYDSSDMYLWEFRYGSWGGLVITSEHRVSYDITIPYNNRLIMELFLSLPLEKRIKDEPHYDLIKHMNSDIDELGITIVNYNETKRRMYLEKFYYLINNILPW
ncbi:MAG: asparagine synthase-related protein [Eubacteriales bacterium]|nr:asparagine synthase-related protein [Eubacteriales bacterium]